MSITMDKKGSSTEGGRYTGTGDKADLKNHSSQCNPNNPEYKGHSDSYQGSATKSDKDNHSNQMNPNNSEYKGNK